VKILITGATGFIGTHLLKTLIQEGRSVRCLTRKPENKKKLEHMGAEVVFGDLLDKASLTPALKGINTIYHLAAEVYSRRVTDYFRHNVTGTINLLDSCRSNGTERFIHCSSIAASGPNPDKSSLLTETDECNPVTPYGRSKYEAEKIVLEYYRRYNVPAVIIRPPTVYGPGQSAVINEFFIQVKKGKFFIMGAGEYLRSLCYVENLVEGLLLAERKKEAIGEIFFIADKEVYTFKELAELIANAEGVKIKLISLSPLIAYNAMFVFSFLQKYLKLNILKLYTIGTMANNLACSILKAENVLSYKPIIKLQEGVVKTVKYLEAKKEI
jgi:nucleoside-diphosphate-sugar epimerase